jgi:hypothetical protein
MSMAPFHAPHASPQSEARRTRLAVLIATLGIAATLLAYAVSPGVRHAVSHAAHSVKGAVSRVFDHDTVPKHKHRAASSAHPKRSATTHARRPAAPPRQPAHPSNQGSARSGRPALTSTPR